jgi:methionine-S-sulfoxide reductase
VVGYSGGKQVNPTYRNIKDHTEALLIEFDPLVVSYQDLALEWSRMHLPTYEGKCQYRSAVWYLNEEQKKAAESVVEEMKASTGKVYTSVDKATRFYRAEEYHQNYFQKNYGFK